MPLNQADRLLEDMVRKNKLASRKARKAKPRSRLARFFRRERAPVPFTAQPPAAKRDRRSDLTVAALGVTLGLICALFPWYIFFNPDEFGVRAMKFGGNGGETGPIMLGSQPQRVGAPSSQEIPPMKLDLLATGTAQREEGDKDEHGTPGLTEQPFPPPLVAFKLVHIANGRAMIEDDSGLFIVQRGDILPDSSRVASIEEREGRWVLVTDVGLVLELPE